MGHQLTKKDIEKMEAEIDHRKYVERPKLIEEVKVAREQGDLSENFEYYAAKRAKNKNESRIRYLDRMIRYAKVIDDSSAENEVGIGDYVTIYYIEDDMEEVCQLVTTIGSDSLNNKISIESPLGRAIRGQLVGSRVTVYVNKDVEYDIEIRAIKKE